MQFSSNILYEATKETMSEFGDDGKIAGEKGIYYKNKRFHKRGVCEMNGNKTGCSFGRREHEREGERSGRLRGRGTAWSAGER